jgi:hypothetical protein
MNAAETPHDLTPDAAAAHELLSELRTRISTQPLAYLDGVEARALESLWEVFEQARSAMKNHPGCVNFAKRTTEMLNIDLRPLTAKWHLAHVEGRLNSRDGGNEFREDLAAAQIKLRQFAIELHKMAYGRPWSDDLTPLPMTEDAVADSLADLPFGIPKNELIAEGAVVDAINADEALAIGKRREKFGIEPTSNNAVGLGLSGGGIRSATFCLGVIQVLAQRDLLKDIDFLSTVSGGGYVGCFLTSRLGRGETHSGVARPQGPDPAPVRYLRQHAKYLSASNLKEQWSMVITTIAGMVLNWTAPLFVISLSALIAIGLASYSPFPWAGMLLFGIFAVLVSLLIYAFRMRYSRLSGGRLLAGTTAATVFIGSIWLLSSAYTIIIENSVNWLIIGIVAAGIAAVPAIVRFVPVLSNPDTRRLVLKIVLVLTGLIIPIGVILVGFYFFYIGTLHLLPDAPLLSALHYADGRALLSGLTIVFGAISLLLLNINLTAPHRLYRDQLARTFIQTSEADVEPVPLGEIDPTHSAPYHLINATVNLPSSTDPALRERKSDFFLFSKCWCGAPSIGYARTPGWQAGRAPIDLATAMAVSGAAASSYMGLGSIASLSALLTFLNVRLGYWILQPKKMRRFQFKTPGFSCLLREMTGVGMSEKQAWLNLSDGGHIENMALYELLRRRCKFIISVDGEADPQSSFHGHLTLVRHVLIDFGIRIEPDLTDLRPGLTSKFSQAHSMMCRVHYPATADHPGGQGIILYLKLSITGNELETIKRYRLVHPDFPHQTTLDQFFDEEQFEAYRQLGVHIAEGLFVRALLHDRDQPTTVKEWFRGLATSLLRPERA